MSTARHENPFIVQSDHTVLVEVDSPRYVEGRDALARFAELVKRVAQSFGFGNSALFIFAWRDYKPRSYKTTPRYSTQTLRCLARIPKRAEFRVLKLCGFCLRMARLQAAELEDNSALLTSNPPLFSPDSEASRVSRSETLRLFCGYCSPNGLQSYNSLHVAAAPSGLVRPILLHFAGGADIVL